MTGRVEELEDVVARKTHLINSLVEECTRLRATLLAIESETKTIRESNELIDNMACSARIAK